MTTPETLPPFDADAEAALVASLLVDHTAYERVADIVSPADFYRDQNRWAYEACRELWLRGETINEVTLAHELSRRGRLDDVGGLAYIAGIVSDLPTPIGVEHYAAIVHRDARWRAMIRAGSQIVQMAYQGGPDFDAGVAKIEAMVATLATGHETSGFRPIAALLDEFWGADADAGAPGMVIRSGLMDLDALVAGMHPGNLVIVAARPSVGKSALMLAIARNAIVAQRARVAFVTLEMSAEECRSRLLAMQTGIDSKRIRQRAITSHLSEAEEAKLMAATGEMCDWPLEIRDRAVANVERLRMELRKVAHKLGGLDLVIVDYLQLIETGRRENRTQEVSEISRALKLLARELSVPVIAASQLSRKVEDRPGAEPRLADLRDSGSIEQDADTVVFLHRLDRVYTEEQWRALAPKYGPYPRGVVKLLVAKQRNGPTGLVYVRTDDTTSRFSDLLDYEQESMAS